MKTDKLYNVAIADDYPSFREGLAALINNFQNFTVKIVASNGVELLDKISNSNVKIDLCIIDLNMPKMNGYETIIQVNKKWPDIKLLILSMYYNEYSIIQTIKDGAVCYLPKESSVSEINHALTEVTNKGYYYSDFVNKLIADSLHNDLIKTKINDNEKRFLCYCCSDLTYQQIAKKMHLSTRTIEGYRNNLFLKLDIKSRSGLILFAIQSGIMILKSELGME